MNKVFDILERIVRSNVYKFYVIFVAMPINGCLIGRGDTLEVTIGALSSISHIPWVLSLYSRW